MFDMLVDLCTILLEKTNDPSNLLINILDIYNIKKEDLIEE